MLYRLELENFFSIRDPQVIDLRIDAKVPDPDGRYAPIFKGSDLRAPKVVALYGANAAGKTNVLRALEALTQLVRDSVQWADGMFPSPPLGRFNDEESANRPIRLAVEFGGPMDLSPEVDRRLRADETVLQGTYRYEVEIARRDSTSGYIRHEALRQKPNGRGKWQRVFERDGDGCIRDSKSFSLSSFRHLVRTLAGNHSVLSSFSRFQHPSAQLFVDAARGIMFHLEPVQATSDQALISYLQSQPHVLSRVQDELGRIDTGIVGLGFINHAAGPQLMFEHRGLQHKMPWALESHGTRAFIKVYPFILAVLASGSICVVDEIDSALHPLILPEVIQQFYDHAGHNPHNAQLWLSCHAASLLDDLNKEEIVICEKDLEGRTRVFSLMDVKVRRDENHYRKYLSGAYGGVPLIG
jgi:hypothetical protein